MHRRFAIAVAVVLAMPFATLTAAAQPPSGLPSAMDLSCDYCEDYTDQTKAAGQARSAYIVGRGYDKQAEGEIAVTPQERETARLLAQRQQRGEAR